MSEEKLSYSKKLDIEGAQRFKAGEEKLKETYKQIAEDIGLAHVTGDTVKNSNMVRENGDSALDGADEKMLNSDEKETLTLKKVEAKILKSDQNLNGDAKIDVGNMEKTFTGMTKEELMKYATDPFWVRLRWILFILFWGLWIAMLAGAIAIIVFAPKCAAPAPLVWWKKGPMITIEGPDDIAKVEKYKEFNAKGVVYELNDEETYLVDTPSVEEKIRNLVESFKAHDIHIVLDLTANYVTEADPLLQKAIGGDSESRSAFVTSNKIYGWKKVNSSKSAWKQAGSTNFLSQFKENYDLQMSSPVAQQKFLGVLNHLVGLGVKGFRLKNAKHFIISPDLGEEQVNNDFKLGLDHYNAQMHHKTVLVDGLGDVLHIFSKAIHNATGGEGFLTIKGDAATYAEKYVVTNTKIFGFDLPRFEVLTHFLTSTKNSDIPRRLFNGFDVPKLSIDMNNLWMQITYNPDLSIPNGLDGSAYNMFMSLLPGAQFVRIETLNYSGNKTQTMVKLEKARESIVNQHGNFTYFMSTNETAFGYARMKSGNPGYFVVLNPSDDDIKAQFTSPIIGNELSVYLLSDNFDNQESIAKQNVNKDSIVMAKHSVAIFTFVPK